VDRQIRASTPSPGAWTRLGEARLKLWPVEPAPDDGASAGPLAPGELRVLRSGVLVGTATMPVGLGDVQPPGKRRMRAADWARGLRQDPAVLG
jgi:methionyl-tRNA formyltransferase